MADVTLRVWVSNQPDGTPCDTTADYIGATPWKAPDGVQHDTTANTLSGPPDAVWAAYRTLRHAVADVGHGPDFEGADLEAPLLTACPITVDEEGGAGAALCEQASPRCATWAQFVKAALLTDDDLVAEE